MENFMEKVENWNSLFLNGLSAAVKTHFESIVSRGIIFEERNIEGFLSEIERENFEKAIKLISTGTSFPTTFADFVNLLKETCIDGKIIALVPCDFSHFICVSTGNIYGIEILSAANCKTAVMRIYCENVKTKFNRQYAASWKYYVDKEKVSDYKSKYVIRLRESNKEIVYPNNKVNLCCRYDEGEAVVLRRIDGRCQIQVEYDCTSIVQNKYLIETIELCYFTESFSSSDYAYSRLATILANYNIGISSLQYAKCSIYHADGTTDKILSSILYKKGEKECVRFFEDGAYWTIYRNGNWSYSKGKSLVIVHNDNSYQLSNKASFVTYDDLQEHFSSGTDISNNFIMYNSVVEIIEKAEKKYYPMHFPDTQRSVH